MTSADKGATHKGRCQCGDVVFTVNTEPNMTTNCHCRMCQKTSGAAFVPRAARRWLFATIKAATSTCPAFYSTILKSSHPKTKFGPIAVEAGLR